MNVRGKVKRGKVVLEEPSAFPDGTEVEIRPVKKTVKPARPQTKKKQRRSSLADRYADFIGSVKDLPPDMSVNLDHYLYGHPKGK